MRNDILAILAAVAGSIAVAGSLPGGARASEIAHVVPDTFSVGVGETARFDVRRDGARTPLDLAASCDIGPADGDISVLFDAESYIPLSAPAVGDRIALAAGETQSLLLTGNILPEGDDAYIAFTPMGAPVAFCFPGQECGEATAGGTELTVSCASQ